MGVSAGKCELLFSSCSMHIPAWICHNFSGISYWKIVLLHRYFVWEEWIKFLKQGFTLCYIGQTSWNVICTTEHIFDWFIRNNKQISLDLAFTHRNTLDNWVIDIIC